MYLGLTILQISTIQQQRISEITDVGMNTKTDTVIPPNELIPISIAEYIVKYKHLI